RPVEQREGLAWAVLREQHPRQHQIFPLPAGGLVRRPRGGRAAGPSGQPRSVTLGEQQPRAPRGHGIGKAYDGWAWRAVASTAAFGCLAWPLCNTGAPCCRVGRDLTSSTAPPEQPAP